MIKIILNYLFNSKFQHSKLSQTEGRINKGQYQNGKKQGFDAHAALRRYTWRDIGWSIWLTSENKSSNEEITKGLWKERIIIFESDIPKIKDEKIITVESHFIEINYTVLMELILFLRCNFYKNLNNKIK